MVETTTIAPEPEVAPGIAVERHHIIARGARLPRLMAPPRQLSGGFVDPGQPPFARHPQHPRGILDQGIDPIGRSGSGARRIVGQLPDVTVSGRETEDPRPPGPDPQGLSAVFEEGIDPGADPVVGHQVAHAIAMHQAAVGAHPEGPGVVFEDGAHRPVGPAGARVGGFLGATEGIAIPIVPDQAIPQGADPQQPLPVFGEGHDVGARQPAGVRIRGPRQRWPIAQDVEPAMMAGQTTETGVGGDPQHAGMVFEDLVDPIRSQAVGIAGIMGIAKEVTVVASPAEDTPAVGTDPEVAGSVFRQRADAPTRGIVELGLGIETLEGAPRWALAIQQAAPGPDP